MKGRKGEKKTLIIYDQWVLAEVKSMFHIGLLWRITTLDLSASECRQGFYVEDQHLQTPSSQAINQGHDKLIFTSIDSRPFLPLIDIYEAVLDENLLVFKINNQPIIQFSENLGPISFFFSQLC